MSNYEAFGSKVLKREGLWAYKPRPLSIQTVCLQVAANKKKPASEGMKSDVGTGSDVAPDVTTFQQ